MAKTGKNKPIQKVLVANRGEIAIRILSTLKQMGVESVAVYATPDANSQHPKHADSSYLLEGNTTTETYLNIEQLILIAKKAQVDAIHPGYGFLSENPEFAKQCEKAGIKLIGPNAEVMQLMGDKITAKQTAEKAGVPVVPGYQQNVLSLSETELQKIAQKIGYPILVKATAGGGGKGMRLVETEAELKPAIELASSEAKKAFGNGDIFLEKYLIKPRHIEVQILADAHGNTLHCGARDCSIQRRHQKIIEEAGDLNLNPTFLNAICEAAVKLAQSVKYQNAGTVEFIVNEAGTEFYFLEMNTRLQVEHPVTEWVYGLDLVAQQIKIAQGKALNIDQADLTPKGHSIECRLYAEDPDNHYLPQTGQIQVWQWPCHIPFTRLDSGYQQGDTVGTDYDPMLAKISVWGNTRNKAIQKMQTVLQQFAILGVTTNHQFLQQVLAHADFSDHKTHTHWLNNTTLKPLNLDGISESELLIMATQFNQAHGNPSINTSTSKAIAPSAWRQFA